MAATPPSLRGRLAAYCGIDDPWERDGGQLRRWDVVFVGLMAAFSGLTLELMRSIGALDTVHAPWWAEWTAVVTGSMLLFGRRRWPLTVLMLAAMHMFLVGVTMPPVMGSLPMQIIYFVAIFCGVSWSRDRRAILVVVSGVLVFMFGWVAWQFALGNAIAQWLSHSERPVTAQGLFPPTTAVVLYTLVINVLYFGGAVLGGQVAWRSARQKAHLAEQAATIIEQSEELQRKAVVDERLRIARELHDVVAHHVSVIGIQAGAGRRVLDTDPAATARALSQVEVSSRQAVEQMRGLLGTLRSLDVAEGDVRAAEPGLGDIADLVTSRCTDGFTVDYDLVEAPAGAADRLPGPVALSIYRTIQEALVNVARHSTANRASVVVRVEEGPATGAEGGSSGYAEVEVLDNGRPRLHTSGSGLGQLGIRERAASLRGQLEIGPRATGGYRVRVRFPLNSNASHASTVRAAS